MSKDKWLGLTFTTKISKNLMTNTRFDFMGKLNRMIPVMIDVKLESKIAENALE